MRKNITIETAENQLDDQEVSFDSTLHCKLKTIFLQNCGSAVLDIFIFQFY